MAENEDGQEKKHEATGQKLDEAAEKGNIPKSQDINSLAILGAGGMALMFGMPMISAPVLQYSADLFSISGPQTMDQNQLLELAGRSMRVCLYSMGLPLGVMVIAAIFAGLAQTWGKLATKALELDIKKLNPLTGFKQMYMSWMPLVELAKGWVSLFCWAQSHCGPYGIGLMKFPLWQPTTPLFWSQSWEIWSLWSSPPVFPSFF